MTIVDSAAKSSAWTMSTVVLLPRGGKRTRTPGTSAAKTRAPKTILTTSIYYLQILLFDPVAVRLKLLTASLGCPLREGGYGAQFTECGERAELIHCLA
jgi:hypothetical protein